MRDFPGGLFHPSDDKQEVAFRYAVEKINANRDILPKSRLSAQIEQIKPQDSFHASKRGERMCACVRACGLRFSSLLPSSTNPPNRSPSRIFNVFRLEGRKVSILTG